MSEVWINAPGAGGIRRDILPEKARDEYAWTMMGLTPAKVRGGLLRECGYTAALLYMHARTDDVWECPCRNFIREELHDTPFYVGTGTILDRGAGNYLRGVFYHSGSGWEQWDHHFFTQSPDEISRPFRVGKSVVVPCGHDALPAAFYYTDGYAGIMATPGAAGIISRPAMLGFPEITSAPGDYMTPPIMADNYVESRNGFLGAIGTTTAPAGLYGAVSETTWVHEDVEYKYAYTGNLDGDGAPKPHGWGYTAGAGMGNYRWTLVEFAVGLVYVYEDDTMSEPTVWRWSNVTTGLIDPRFAPFNLLYQSTDGHESIIVAFKGRIILNSESLRLNRRIKGVRVFYTHNSRLGFEDTLANGYTGWNEEADIFDNMRECLYVDEDDEANGMLRMKNADEGALETWVPDAAVRLGEFICPCEKTVAAASEISASTSAQNVTVRTPLYLKPKFAEIRGELAERNGVIVHLRKYDGDSHSRMAVRVYEQGKMVKEYATFTGTPLLWSMPGTSVTDIRTRRDIYACAYEVGMTHKGRTFISGARFKESEEPDYETVYASHISPEGVCYYHTFPSALSIPLTKGTFRGMAAAGNELFIVTDRSAYAVDFGDGSVESWMVREIAGVVSACVSHRSIVSAGPEVYYAAEDGHLYMYQSGTENVVRVTEGLAGTTPLTGTFGTTFSDATLVFDGVRQMVNACFYKKRSVTPFAVSYHRIDKTCWLTRKVFIDAVTGANGLVYVTDGFEVRAFSETSNVIPMMETAITQYTLIENGECDATGELIAARIVSDKDFYLKWTPPNDPGTKEARIMVFADPDNIMGGPLAISTGGRTCFESTGFQLVTAYDPDNDIPNLVGRVDVGVDLYRYVRGGKDPCAFPPLAWALFGVDDGTYGWSDRAIDWYLEKLVALPGPGPVILTNLLMDCDTATAEALTLALYQGESATEAWRLTINSKVIDGLLEYPMRITSEGNRLRFKLSGAGATATRFLLRRIGLALENFGLRRRGS